MKLLSFSGDMEEANEVSGICSATSRTACRFCYSPSCEHDEAQFLKKEWQKQVIKRQMHICERIRKQALEDLNVRGNFNVELLKEAGLLPEVPIITVSGPSFNRSIQVSNILIFVFPGLRRATVTNVLIGRS